MANTFTARDTLKTKLLAALSSATNADQIVKLSRTIEKANLDDDADLETALDTKVSAMATTASTGDIEKLAFGVKKLRTAATASDPVSSMVPEGSSNLYVTDSRVRSSFSASGDLSYDSGTGVLSYTALPDALTVYATVADLPLPENTNVGAKGIVEENKKLYINSGSAWLNVGLVDQKPNFTTTPDGSYTLSPGADTVITLAATDPQGDPITFSHVVSAGTLGGTTVSQADNVFTITGSSDTNDTAPFSITFRASDGTNITDTTSEFTISFGIDWSTYNSYTVLTLENPFLDSPQLNPGNGSYYDTPTDYATDNGDNNDHFGASVAISENYYVVGSTKRVRGSGWRGGAYSLYDKSGTLLRTFDDWVNRHALGGENYHSYRGQWDAVILESKGVVVFGNGTGRATNTSTSNRLVVTIFSIATGNLVSEIVHPSWGWFDCTSASTDENTVYFGQRGHGMQPLNVSDPANPSWSSHGWGEYSGGGQFRFRDMGVKNNWMVYGADGHTGLNTEDGRWSLINFNTGAGHTMDYQHLQNIPQTGQSHKDGFDANYRLEWYANMGMSVAINDNYVAVGVSGYSYGRAYHGVVLLYAFDSTDDNASAPVLKGWFHPSNATWPSSSSIWLRENRAHDVAGSLYFGTGVRMTDEAIFISSQNRDFGNHAKTHTSYIIGANLDAIPTNGDGSEMIDLFSGGSQIITAENPELSNSTFNMFSLGFSRRFNFAVHGTEVIVGAYDGQVTRASDNLTFEAAGKAFVYKATI